MDRAILHCDMNNFYASVECMLDKSLRDKPVAVCGAENERHGIVLAKNYLAKDFGVNVGDAIWQAKQKCKNIVIIDRPNFDEYQKYSKLAHEIYNRFTDYVEPFGLDECWLDVTNSQKLFGDAVKIANTIRETIKKELDLTISVGVSFNKIFAKLASDLKKPDATTVISKENFKDKIWSLPANTLFGVGRKTEKVLDKYFIKTIGDIANESIDSLVYWFGKNGEMLYNYANGFDTSSVSKYNDLDEVKSVSHGITTVVDLKTTDEVWKVMLELTQEIAYRLREKKLRTTCISVSIRDKDLMWHQFQKKLAHSEQSAINIASNSFELFKSKFEFTKPIRNVTIQASGLINENTPEQLEIYYNKLDKLKVESAEKCMESINIKYGNNIVKNAALINDCKIPNSRRKLKYDKQ